MKTYTVTNGASKYDLMLALFEGKDVWFDLEEVVVGRAGVRVSTLTRIDDDHGHNNHWKIVGWFVLSVDTHTCATPIEEFEKCEIDFSVHNRRGTFTALGISAR
jgi:hypothetical protein